MLNQKLDLQTHNVTVCSERPLKTFVLYRGSSQLNRSECKTCKHREEEAKKGTDGEKQIYESIQMKINAQMQIPNHE